MLIFYERYSEKCFIHYLIKVKTVVISLSYFFVTEIFRDQGTEENGAIKAKVQFSLEDVSTFLPCYCVL